MKILRHMVPGKKAYIGQLEMLVAAFMTEALQTDMLAGRSAVFWIDSLSV